MFNILLEAVYEGVIIVNEQQKIAEANATAAKMFGYSREELIEQSLDILIPQRYHAEHGAHFNSFMKQRESRQMGHGRDL
ncbi:PAS domain-containing protein [Kordia sp.]|uniref:PAS domain-containing protein n=1 Tax=Kordia sp. TaxID=1965332 RepID=UPI0034507D9A